MSNDQFDDLEILDQYIEDAGEALKEVLRHQMTPNSGEFGRVCRMLVNTCVSCRWLHLAQYHQKTYSFK